MANDMPLTLHIPIPKLGAELERLTEVRVLGFTLRPAVTEVGVIEGNDSTSGHRGWINPPQ